MNKRDPIIPLPAPKRNRALMYLDQISSHIAQIIFLRKGDMFPFNTSVRFK